MLNIRGKRMRNIKEEVAKAREGAEKFAKSAGLSKSEFEKMFEDAKKEMQARPGMPDELVEKYAYSRVSQGLKLRFSSSAPLFEGFFFGKHEPFDFAAKPLEEANDMAIELGKEYCIRNAICDSTFGPLAYHVDAETGEPIPSMLGGDEEDDKIKKVPPMSSEELKEFAFNKGKELMKNKYVTNDKGKQFSLVNEKGNFIYTKPDFKVGQEIPEHDYSSEAYGIFRADGDKEFRLATVNLRGDNAVRPLPAFRYLKINGSINKKKTTAQSYAINLRKPPYDIEEEIINYWDYEPLLQEVAPERVMGDLTEVMRYAEEKDEFRGFCIVQADLLDITPTGPDAASIALKVSDHSLSDSKNTPQITFWYPKDAEMDVEEGAMDCVFVLSPYKKRDGEISGNCLGIWADPMFRATKADDLDEEDVMKAWS